MKVRFFAAVALVATLLSGVAVYTVDSVQAQDASETIFENIQDNENFSILVAALEFTELDAVVNDPNLGLTVFTPTNSAFEQTLGDLGLTPGDLLTEANKQLTTDILLYHVIEAVVFSNDVIALDGQTATTALGAPIFIEVDDQVGITLNGGVHVTAADREASNGVTHVVDTVLLPTDQFGFEDTLYDLVRQRDNFSILTAALEFTGLDETLDGNTDFTVFAPTNDAFERTLSDLGLTPADLLTEANKQLTTDILLYHVLPGIVLEETVLQLDGQSATTALGADIFIEIDGDDIILNGGVNVRITDLLTSNGAAHVIDRVLLPTDQFGFEDTLYDAVRNSDNFTILTAALEFTDLDETLDGNTDFTLFAPTDTAFEHTLADLGLTPADLLTEANKQLTTDILLYHVISGVVLEETVLQLDGQSATTVLGADIFIEIDGDDIILNGGVNVRVTDRIVSNGVYHVIDGVLLPTDEFGFEDTLYDAVRNSDNFTILTAALEFTELDAVLDGNTDFTVLAPTDAAFERSLSELGLTPADLLTEANKQLTTDILLYHVIPGIVLEETVISLDGQQAPTVQGTPISVHVEGDDHIILNGEVNVIATDFEASNGVYHVLNRVLLFPVDEITGFTLVDAHTNEDIQDINDGDVLDVPMTAVNIRANTPLGGVASMMLSLNDGEIARVENVSPYALAGDFSGDYNGFNLHPGEYTLTAMIYSKLNGQGEVLGSRTISFIVGTPINDTEVVSFTLVNAETDEDIMELSDGAVIQHPDHQINIRANTSPEEVGSVILYLNSNMFGRIENVAPYALAGDLDGDYWPLSLAPGDYTLTAVIYSQRDGQGEMGGSATITFTIE